ncbi:DUF2339 domain-containing protein [Vibrio algarum]|uniref:DUF2339 domain-containing protein n=1 Tax=Vibrio algarum TaxID=3020714 RepID=A0ABT4YRR3_9VIBR|nr:DUF2339 domain-containing protein [Vibrio sp. KJ40-1]MDB1124080.1 DUF2339 domain-containing protein [Vibrio sp. KJ40-1]
MDILILLAICVLVSPIILSIVAFNKAKSLNIVIDKLREQLERLKTDHELLRLEFEMQQTRPRSESESSGVDEIDSTHKEEPITSVEANLMPNKVGSNSIETVSKPTVIQPDYNVMGAEKVVLAGESISYSEKLFGFLSSIKKRLPEPMARLVGKISPIALVGLGIVFVGLSFLIKLTYQAFSVPLWFKLSAIAVAGFCCVGLGWRLRKKPNYFGVALQGSGMAVLYLVVIAAGRYFALIPIELTFLLLSVLVVITTLLALLQNAQIMAVVAALAGFAVPVLLSTEATGNHLILLGYYLLLNLGLVFLAYKKKWYFLEKSGVICTFVLVEFWLVFSYHSSLMWETLPFLASYFFLYFLLAHSHACEDFSNRKQVISSVLVFTLPLTTYALFYTATATVAEYTAYSSLFLFVCYTVAAFTTSKLQKNSQLVYVYKAFALLFLAVAIPVFFSATFTAAIYALKAAMILWLSNKQVRSKFALVGLAFLMASFYQLYQLHEDILFYPTVIWSWIIQLMLICLVLAYYVSDWSFSYKTSRFSLARETISQCAMAAIVLLTVIPWLWVMLVDVHSLLFIQFIFVTVLLFVGHQFSRSQFSWGTLLLPLIVTIYFVITSCRDLIISGFATIVSVALLYKTSFPIKQKVVSLCSMAWLNVLLGVFVIIASTRANWHDSIEFILVTYFFVTLLACFALYRATKWVVITQLFWLSLFGLCC